MSSRNTSHVNSGVEHRLSPQQDHLWRMLCARGAAHQRRRGIIALEGPHDRPALIGALQDLVHAHDIFRTCLIRDGEDARLLVGTHPPDLRVESPASTDGPGIAHDASSSGDPRSVCALTAIRLMRDDAARQRIAIDAHPLGVDAASIREIARELGCRYECRLAGLPYDVEPLQYAEAIEIFNELASSADTAAGRRYWDAQRWRERAGLERVLGRDDAGSSPFGSASVRVTLADGALEALDQAAAHEETSRRSWLMAAWAVVLHRLTADATLSLMVQSDGRTDAAFEGALGLYERWLPLTMSVHTAEPLRETAMRIERALREMDRWQDYLPANAVASPAGAGFEYHEVPARQHVGGLVIGIERIERPALCAIELACRRSQGRLQLSIRYDRHRYAKQTMMHLLHAVRDVACDDRAARGGVASSIGKAPVPRRARNDRAVDLLDRDDTTLVAWFERAAAAHQHRTAVRCDEDAASYGDLNARANRIAHRLRALGVGPETIVGLWLDRSVDLVAALIGVLKAGGAYLPLDPSAPASRNAFILGDARASVVIVEKTTRAQVPPTTAIVLDLDEQHDRIAAASAGNLPRCTRPEHLAYIIYTSGSTGRPKGVLVEHRQVTRLFLSTAHWIRPGDSDVWTFFHSPAFDFSVWEIWGALLYGGTLIVVPSSIARAPDAFCALLARERVTVLNQTPLAFQHLSRFADALEIPLTSLRLVIFGGEKLEFASLEPWVARHGDRRPALLNMYGITETTVHVTKYRVRAADIRARRPSLIGVPIPDLELFVLSPLGEVLPPGAAGELYVGGDGLARGYLNHPDLTADRFVPHPFAHGERLYRTGDRVRRLPGGGLAYLDRVDRQVKVRGFRIELAEIEDALRRHPDVRDGVVTTRTDAQGQVMLAAYYVCHAAARVEAAALRTFLGSVLPDYMLPAMYVPLDALPLSVNGKVDRGALPDPAAARPRPSAAQAASASAPSAPGDDIEALLCVIWADVLAVDEVRLDDDFYQLGGHSLLATRAVARIRTAFRVDLSIRRFLELPTVRTVLPEVRRLLGATAVDDTARIPRVPRDRPLELSFAQQRLWFLDRLAPGHAAYNVPLAVRCTGALRVDALARAIQAVVRRHEILRTTIDEQDDGPVQKIAERITVALPVIDLQALPAEARAEAARRHGAAIIGRPFDLAAGPLLCAAVVRLSAAEHVVVLVCHHITIDAASLPTLVEELRVSYEAIARGEAPPSRPAPLQYADIAAWQWERLRTGGDAQLAWWTRALAGAPDLDVPTDFRRPPSPSYRGDRHRFTIGPGTTAALKTLARQEGVTPFMLLLALFAACLSRWSGQADLVIGCPTSGRLRDDLAGAIGCLMNVLPLRLRWTGDPTFGELVTLAREAALGAYGHQEMPFERLVSSLVQTRDLSRHPCFQVMLVYQQHAPRMFRLADLEVRPCELEVRGAKVDVSLSIADAGHELEAWIEYDTALFAPATIARIAERFQRLVEAAVRDPGRRVSRLPWLSEAETQAAIASAYGPRRAYAPGLVPDLVTAAAEARPDAVAVRFEGATLTYGALNARANRLAHALQARGVGVETRVGVCLDRSLELVVALLGILKAGGAYVPLDPLYPAARRAEMSAQAGVRLVLTHDGAAPPSPGLATLDVAAATDAGAPWPATTPASAARADSLAYVIFTSGSTGRPKGAMNSHGAIANKLRWMQETFALATDDRVLQKTPISFDVSVWEFFWPLLAQAQLVMARPGGHQDSVYLRHMIEDERLTTVHFVPSMLQAFLQAEPGAEWSGVRRVFVSGEALTDDLQAQFAAQAGRPLFNLYGPTEAAVEVTGWRCEPGRPVRLGRPIANVQTYVLDAAQQIVAPGVIGELHLGGAAVGRGYVGQPEWTAEKFVPDPYGPPGSRVYRTGDLARYEDGGVLEFLGRCDEQLKIRGYRVELGDVTAAVRRCRGVVDAVVVARRDGGDGPRLVAYVIEGPEGTGGVSALRAQVQQQVPDYLVPAAFVFVTEWPLTVSGKLDRRALPPPGETRPAIDAGFIGPRTPGEAALAGIWETVLRVHPVGVHDNFFELGGDSMSATRVISRARAAFDEEIRLVDLFETPTIAALAERWAPSPETSPETSAETSHCATPTS